MTALKISLIDTAPETANLPDWLASGQATGARAIALAPDDDAKSLAGHLDGLDAIVLTFPNFNDGRAYSQARLLRTRLGFDGHLVATGNVLVDQLPFMWRCGFDQAVLEPGKDAGDAERFFGIVTDHYQGDAREAPEFIRAAAPSRP